MKHGGSFHSYVNVYQRVKKKHWENPQKPRRNVETTSYEFLKNVTCVGKMHD